jgi:hypothetical protein
MNLRTPWSTAESGTLEASLLCFLGVAPGGLVQPARGAAGVPSVRAASCSSCLEASAPMCVDVLSCFVVLVLVLVLEGGGLYLCSGRGIVSEVRDSKLGFFPPKFKFHTRFEFTHEINGHKEQEL